MNCIVQMERKIKERKIAKERLFVIRLCGIIGSDRK